MIIHLQEYMLGLHKNEPKVYNKYNIIDVQHEPKGGGNPQSGKIGPRREENMDKPKSNHLISMEYLQSPTLEAQRRHPKDGPIRP